MGYFYPDKVNSGVSYLNYAINHIDNAINKVNQCNYYMSYKIKNRLYYNLSACSNTLSGYKGSAKNIKNNINDVVSEYYRISRKTAANVIQKAEITSPFSMQLSNDLQSLGAVGTGFDTVIEIGKSNLENIMKAGENFGNKILNKADNFITGAQKLGSDAVNILNDLGNNAKSAFKATGAAIIDGARNWWEDVVNNEHLKSAFEALKNAGATILSTAATGLAAAAQGLKNLEESLMDFAVLAGAVSISLPAALIDAGNYLINGEKAGALETLWGKTKSFVATEYVNNAFDWVFNETELGQKINEKSLLKYGSDGYNLVSALSEIAGTIVLTYVTGGGYGLVAGGGSLARAGATTLVKSFGKNSAKVAFAAGTGRGTQEAYNSNTAVIQMGTDNFNLDLSHDELNKLNGLQTGEVYTKQIPSVDENGNEITMQFDFVKNADGTISVTVNGQTFKTTISEVNAMEGLTYGLASGAWDGFQWYAGSKLGGLGLKAVGFDIASGAAEVPLRSSMQGIYSDNTWNERFEANGGKMGVITNMTIAGVLSGAGETKAIKKMFGNENKAAVFKSKVQTAKSNAAATVNKATTKAKNLKDKLSDSIASKLTGSINATANFKNSKINYKELFAKKAKNQTFNPVRQGLKAMANAASFVSILPTSFIYTPIAKNVEMPLKIYTEGLYHLTNEKAADSIIVSKTVRASNNLTSYGSKKSFFFAGIPDTGNVAYNIDGLPPTAVAVKVNPKAEHLKLFDYRSLGDKAVTHKGNLDLTDMDVSKVYLGLKNDNGNLVYREIPKEEYDNYHLDLTEEQMSLVGESKMAKIKADFYGISYRTNTQLELFSEALDALKNDLKANVTNASKTVLSYVADVQNLFKDLTINFKDTGATIIEKAKASFNSAINPVYNLKVQSPLDWLFNKLADKKITQGIQEIPPIKQVVYEDYENVMSRETFDYLQDLYNSDAKICVSQIDSSNLESILEKGLYLNGRGGRTNATRSQLNNQAIEAERLGQISYKQNTHLSSQSTNSLKEGIVSLKAAINSGNTTQINDLYNQVFIQGRVEQTFKAVDEFGIKNKAGNNYSKRVVEAMLDGHPSGYRLITSSNDARKILRQFTPKELKELLDIRDVVATKLNSQNIVYNSSKRPSLIQENIKSDLKELQAYAEKVKNCTDEDLPQGYADVSEYKKSFVWEVIAGKQIDNFDFLFELTKDPTMFSELIGTEQLSRLYVKNLSIPGNTSRLVSSLSKLDNADFNRFFELPEIKEFITSLKPEELGSILKKFDGNSNLAWLQNDMIINKITNMNEIDFYKFSENLGFYSPQIESFLQTNADPKNYLKLVETIDTKFYSRKFIKENIKYRQTIDSILPSSWKTTENSKLDETIRRIKTTESQTEKDLIYAIIDSSNGQIDGDMRVVNIDLKKKYYDVTYSIDGIETQTTCEQYNLGKGLDLSMFKTNNNYAQAALDGRLKITEIKVNEKKSNLVLARDDGLVEGLNEITFNVDGVDKKIVINFDGSVINLNSRNQFDFRDATNVQLKDVKPLKSYNMQVDDKNALYRLSYVIDGKTYEAYLDVPKQNSLFGFDGRTLDVDKFIEKNQLYGISDIQVSKVTDMAPLKCSLIEEYSASDKVFSASQYGGNQSDVSRLIKSGLDKQKLSAIDQKKYELLSGLIDKYLPNATEKQKLDLALNYSEAGCFYMATSNALIMHIGSKPNGKSLFKEKFGFDLIMTDGDNSSYNYEALAFDFYLKTQLKNHGNDISSIIKKGNGVSDASLNDALKNYFNSYGIDADIKTSSALREGNDIKNELLIDTINNKGISIVNAKNFDMKNLSGITSENDTLDKALAGSTLDGDIRRGIGEHSMMVTGINEKGNLIVSSWNKKFEFLPESIAEHQSKGQKATANIITISFKPDVSRMDMYSAPGVRSIKNQNTNSEIETGHDSRLRVSEEELHLRKQKIDDLKVSLRNMGAITPENKSILDALLKNLEEGVKVDSTFEKLLLNLDAIFKHSPDFRMFFVDNSFGGSYNFILDQYSLGRNLSDFSNGDRLSFTALHEMGHTLFNKFKGSRQERDLGFFGTQEFFGVVPNKKMTNIIQNAQNFMQGNHTEVIQYLSRNDESWRSVREEAKRKFSLIREAETQRICQNVDEIFDSGNSYKLESMLRKAGISNDRINVLMGDPEKLKEVLIKTNELDIVDLLHNDIASLSEENLGSTNLDAMLNSIIQSEKYGNINFKYFHPDSYWVRKDGVDGACRDSYDELMADYLAFKGFGREDLIDDLRTLAGDELVDSLEAEYNEILGILDSKGLIVR